MTKTKTNLLVEKEQWEAFCELVPKAGDRNQIVSEWIKAYTDAQGDYERLLSESPLIGKLLERINSDRELIKELEAFMLRRTKEEFVGEKVIKVGESWIL